MKSADSLQGPDGPRQRRFLLLAPLIVLGLVLVAGHTEWFQRLDYMSLSYLMKSRVQRGDRGDPRLFFVGIDDPTVNAFGKWPFRRLKHAELLALLAHVKPAVVVWDIFFSEPDIEHAGDDDAMVEGIERVEAPVISAAARAQGPPGIPAGEMTPEVLGFTAPLPNVEGDASKLLSSEAALLPIAPLRTSSWFGFADSPPESDGVRRKLPLVVKVGNQVFPNLALAALMKYWDVAPGQVRVVPGRHIVLENERVRRVVPIDVSGSCWVNYRHETEGFRNSSYVGLSKRLMERFVKQTDARVPELDGAIVFIGQTGEGMSDVGPTPLSRLSPLPLMHLNMMDNILNEDFLKFANPWLVWMIWLGACYLTLFGLERRSLWLAGSVPLLMVALYLGVAQVVFARTSLWLPVVGPVLGFAAVHVGATGRRALIEQRARQEFKATFGAYLAPRVIDELLKDPQQLRLGGVRKPVTILFSDVRGFTSISEASGEEELVAQLNEYFTEMVECVNRHAGTLHKFIGDAVMAVWGDLLSSGEQADAQNAVRCALDMRHALARLNTGWREQGRREWRMGIGLNHGQVLVGNVGAPQRKEFTVIGDAVNFASRLEGVTKEFHTDIVLGANVEALVGPEFVVRTVGVVVVKGKTKPARVHELVGATGDAGLGFDSAWLAEYERGFGNYLAGRFAEAMQAFAFCLEKHPDDFCCLLYREACEELAKTPPASWDGVYAMKTK